MNNTTSPLKQFCKIIDAPQFAQSWMDRFFEKDEIELVLALAQKPLPAVQITARLSSGKKKTIRCRPAAIPGSLL